MVTEDRDSKQNVFIRDRVLIANWMDRRPPEGKHEFAFELKVPMGHPPTVYSAFEKDHYLVASRIKYKVKAQVLADSAAEILRREPMKTTLRAKERIRVSSTATPEVKTPNFNVTDSLVKEVGFAEGNIKVPFKVTVNRDFATAGETLTIIAEADNREVDSKCNLVVTH